MAPTPRKKPIVEKVLAEALADVKAGRISKPFKSAREFVHVAKRHGRELTKGQSAR